VIQEPLASDSKLF